MLPSSTRIVGASHESVATVFVFKTIASALGTYDFASRPIHLTYDETSAICIILTATENISVCELTDHGAS